MASQAGQTSQAGQQGANAAAPGTAATNISPTAQQHRQILLNAMTTAGFINYPTRVVALFLRRPLLGTREKTLLALYSHTTEPMRDVIGRGLRLSSSAGAGRSLILWPWFAQDIANTAQCV